MLKLRVFRIFAGALIGIGRHLPWLVVSALPLLALHAYIVLLTTPLMRVAFVNSFLKPADALQRGGYEIKMLKGLQIAPGPGYSFPIVLTVAVIVLEAAALVFFVMSAQRRFAGRNASGSWSLDTTLRWFAACGFGAVMLAVAVLAEHALRPLSMQIHAMPAEMPFSVVLPGLRDVSMALVLGALGGWVLVKAGLACLALFQSGGRHRPPDPIEMMTADPSRTLGLVGLLGLVLAVAQVVPPILELRLFRPGEVPLGFYGLHYFALTTFLLQFWLRLVLATAVVTVLSSHYGSDRADTTR